MDTVVIYPGRFHPFHKGHKSVYDALVKRFGKDRVFIATSNKIDPPKSPFSFSEKQSMMALTGVDPSRVVQVKNPYIADEITSKYDPKNTIALFAVSDKDMAEDPRFSFKPKKDGSPSYYQPAQKNMRPFEEHGYIVTVPVLDFKVLGQPMRSATEFRANFAKADSETQREMITDLFGKYDSGVHRTMSQKIVEQLQRADAILDKLIELGADDKYIVEACARVDMLKERVLKENRRQSLYQAIMEGGHSLPETKIVREADYSAWDHKEPVAYAEHLAKTFGEPDEHTKEQAVWHNVDGFKRIVVRDEYILHGSPAPHYDFCYSYIDLEVDEDLSDELAKCSGSILIDHLKNEVGARCGSITANATTLNFCLDVVAGRTEPTKEEYEKRILGMSDMFERGMKTTYDWWPDESNDADPENPYYAESVSEEITDFNKEDPMNSVIAIRGIGTMSISSALDKVGEMAKDIAKLGAMKNAKDVQDNLPRYIDLLATYSNSIQEAYRELAAQRRRGGTASRGIDKDIEEGYITATPANPLAMMGQPSRSGVGNDALGTLNVVTKRAQKHYDAYDKKQQAQDARQGALQSQIDQIKPAKPVPGLAQRKVKATEHCGDPMADDHKPMRMLLMKLYQKEMQCEPGSPEHFEVVKMIDGCRKNIGLDENVVANIIDKVKSDFKKRKQLLGKGTTA